MLKKGDEANYRSNPSGTPHKVRLLSTPRRIAGGISVSVEVVDKQNWHSTISRWTAAMCNLYPLDQDTE